MGGTRPLFLWSKRRFDILYENRAHRINEEIRFPRVRLVDEEGNMVGIVPIEDAQQKAYDANLDLVLVSPSPDNPVC